MLRCTLPKESEVEFALIYSTSRVKARLAMRVYFKNQKRILKYVDVRAEGTSRSYYSKLQHLCKGTSMWLEVQHSSKYLVVSMIPVLERVDVSNSQVLFLNKQSAQETIVNISAQIPKSTLLHLTVHELASSIVGLLIASRHNITTSTTLCLVKTKDLSILGCQMV